MALREDLSLRLLRGVCGLRGVALLGKLKMDSSLNFDWVIELLFVNVILLYENLCVAIRGFYFLSSFFCKPYIVSDLMERFLVL